MVAKITELRAENVKRLRAVQVNPDGATVVIGGRNGQGKSSLLDAILYALAGQRAIASKPLRNGADKGFTELRIEGVPMAGHEGTITVRRDFIEGGKSRLEIRSEDGYLAAEPQRLLDGLYDKLSFDPLAFMRFRPQDQLGMLRELVGVDMTELDQERASVYATRTDLNKKAKQAQAELNACPKVEGVPDEEISVADLMAEMQQREATNQHNNQQRIRAKQLEEKIANKRANTEVLEAEIEKLRERLRNLLDEINTLCDHRDAMDLTLANLHDADVGEVRQAISEADQTNRRIRQNQKRQQLAEAAYKLESESKRLTKRIEEIDSEKEQLIAAAQFPVAGLGFDETGITFNGLPFEQASSAEQLRVSVAMGLALNPTLKVMLIRDGSLLDGDSLKLLAELADTADAQIWIERVGTGEEVSVVIEDGVVVSGSRNHKTSDTLTNPADTAAT